MDIESATLAPPEGTPTATAPAAPPFNGSSVPARATGEDSDAASATVPPPADGGSRPLTKAEILQLMQQPEVRAEVDALGQKQASRIISRKDKELAQYQAQLASNQAERQYRDVVERARQGDYEAEQQLAQSRVQELDRFDLINDPNLQAQAIQSVMQHTLNDPKVRSRYPAAVLAEAEANADTVADLWLALQAWELKHHVPQTEVSARVKAEVEKERLRHLRNGANPDSSRSEGGPTGAAEALRELQALNSAIGRRGFASAQQAKRQELLLDQLRGTARSRSA